MFTMQNNILKEKSLSKFLTNPLIKMANIKNILHKNNVIESLNGLAMYSIPNS